MSKKEENWEDSRPLDYRTKLGLRVLLLIFKVISPYKFAHDFEKEIAAIQKQVDDA